MATPLATFLNEVDALITANDDELPETARQSAVKRALETYSQDRPDTKTADVTGTGAQYYALTTALTSWSEGFSRITRIEYPAVTIATGGQPQYLEPDDWREDYWAADVRYLYLPNHTPASTETLRITYTVPYGWSATSQTTTPAADFYALCHLAAAYCCQAIAAKYSRTSESTIAADSVDHRSRADLFASRAKEFTKLYQEHIRQNESQADAPAGAFVDWDTAPGWPEGRAYLYHRGR